MNIIKNKFIHLLIVSSLTLNTLNIYSFSINNLLRQSQKCSLSLSSWFEQNSEGIAKGASILFTATLIAFAIHCELKNIAEKQKEKEDHNKKRTSKCIICKKLNEYCTCDLLNKINHIFQKHGTIKVKRYLNNHYEGSNFTWKTKKIKIALSKINNINMKIPSEDNSNKTPLHIACFYGHKPIIKWLIEDMFVDINVTDAAGSLPTDYLKNTISYCQQESKSKKSNLHFLSKVNPLLIEKKMAIQEDLINNVKNLKKLFIDHDSTKNEKLFISMVKEKLKKIKELLSNKKTPGFAKQLVLPDLIFIHKNYSEHITEKDISTFYTYIAFNYTFLNDERFSDAVEFAIDKEFVDIYERNIAQAQDIYREENKITKIDPFRKK